MGHGSDSCIANEVGSFELGEELVDQHHSEAEVESSDYVTLTVGMCSVFIYRNIKIECSLTSFSVTRAVTLQFNFYHSDTINRNEIEVEKQATSSNTKVGPYHVNVKPGQGCDKSKMYVPTSMGRYSKRYCCLYCLKRYSKLVRHFTTVHKDEVEVKKFQALPLGKICLQYIYSKYSK